MTSLPYMRVADVAAVRMDSLSTGQVSLGIVLSFCEHSHVSHMSNSTLCSHGRAQGSSSIKPMACAIHASPMPPRVVPGRCQPQEHVQVRVVWSRRGVWLVNNHAWVGHSTMPGEDWRSHRSPGGGPSAAS